VAAEEPDVLTSRARSFWLRRLAALAPPPLRRVAVGALVDLRGLPGRIADPARRGEPWASIHNIGGGDFHIVGLQLLEVLRKHAGLLPGDSVLDIGCGAGRVAGPLATFLAAGGGRYLGFDIHKAGINNCRRRFAGEPHLRFAHLDVRNPEYNAQGRQSELGAVFPAQDASVDLAFATSVFTHMRLPAVARYLQECARVLRPGGRLAFTVFALSPGREANAAYPFLPFEAASAVLDPRTPERAIGHQRAALEAAIADAGLRVVEVFNGEWSPPRAYEGGQDLIVALKP
jgi:SAM-dependent methyltransferase